MSDGLGPPSSLPSNYTYPPTSRPPEDDLDRLVFLDNQLDSHIQRILQCLDSMADPNPLSQPRIQLSLAEEQRWLSTSLGQLGGLKAHHDTSVRQLVEAMQERLSVFSSTIDYYLEVLSPRSPLEVNPHVKSGMCVFTLDSALF